MRLSDAAREALIERTRHARITPATAQAMFARAPKCQWCGKSALKGQAWCKRHAPGLARDRNCKLAFRPETAARHKAMISAITTESACERILPAGLESWPPIARIVAHRPRHTRPVKLSEVIAALTARGVGDHAPWADLVHRMRDNGIMRDRDRDIAQT